MATELLKSANGQVFRNTNGQVLKANYDKGNGYRLLTVNNEVRVDFTYTGEYTFIGGVSGNDFDPAYDIYSWRLTNLGGINISSQRVTARISDSGSYWGRAVYGPTMPDINFGAIRVYNDLSYDIFGNGIFSNRAYYTNVALDVEAIRVGVDPRFGFSNQNLHFIFYFFDRILSNDEIIAIYNNRQLASPITNSGLKIYFNFNKAEVLDFSLAQDGSDLRAGFRDMSGNNNHGYVMGISGTPQDVVNEVNANRIFTV